MWKNKHVVTAIIVAPILAIITYVAIDYTVSERPHAAKAGSSYPLLAKSNCRYESGKCDLENGDVRLTLTRTGDATQTPRLQLVSALPLVGANVAFVTDADADADADPVGLTADDDSATAWSIEMDAAQMPDSSLRLVVVANQSNYFVEVPTIFFEREERLSR